MLDMSAFGRLTEAQRVTLRLYHQHLQIKEIAEQLGISESTVNQRLTQCRRVVAAPSSRAAAKWFASYERENGIYNKSAYQFSTMATDVILFPDESLDTVGTGDDQQDEERTRDEHPATPGPDAHKPFPWPFATQKAPDNNLDWWTRIALVLPVAAFLLFVVIVLVLFGIGLQDALVDLQHLFVR